MCSRKYSGYWPKAFRRITLSLLLTRFTKSNVIHKIRNDMIYEKILTFRCYHLSRLNTLVESSAPSILVFEFKYRIQELQCFFINEFLPFVIDRGVKIQKIKRKRPWWAQFLNIFPPRIFQFDCSSVSVCLFVVWKISTASIILFVLSTYYRRQRRPIKLIKINWTNYLRFA